MGAQGLICLGCLARSWEPPGEREEVFELVEGVCSVCGAFGAAAARLPAPPQGEGAEPSFRC